MMPHQILVVDDDSPIRECLVELLAEYGYDVRDATDGLDALAQVEDWRPDLILLDLMMPWMDGFAFRAEQLRRPALAEVPVIVLSAVAERTPCDSLGAVAVVQKPFELDHLLALVARHTEPRAA